MEQVYNLLYYYHLEMDFYPVLHLHRDLNIRVKDYFRMVGVADITKCYMRFGTNCFTFGARYATMVLWLGG